MILSTFKGSDQFLKHDAYYILLRNKFIGRGKDLGWRPRLSSKKATINLENMGKELRVRVLMMTKIHIQVRSIFFIVPGFLCR